mgnify:CR=1 FL=1
MRKVLDGGNETDLFDPSAFADVPIPMVVLVGGDSPEDMQSAVRSVADGFLEGEVVTVEGQEHMAMHEAPSVFNDAN